MSASWNDLVLNLERSKVNWSYSMYISCLVDLVSAIIWIWMDSDSLLDRILNTTKDYRNGLFLANFDVKSASTLAKAALLE
jgi:hypothetical protein